MKTKPLASLSLDLDNEWSYLRVHGDESWKSFPSYLDVVVPATLGFLERRQLRITYFVVGQDAAIASNGPALRQIVAAGHEIGNHSFHHEPWLHLYDLPRLEKEIADAESAIQAATGKTPVGFRGPGFSLSPATLAVLGRRGYLYDASTLPTFIGPLAKRYYFAASKLSQDQKQERECLFGKASEGLRPLKPYFWSVEGRHLLEIPVTTFPLLRIPIHISYILYLGSYSERLAQAYFRSALTVCRQSGVSPSILLHPLDFISGEEVPSLRFFPAMNLPAAKKQRIIGRAIDSLQDLFNVCTMEQHAASLAQATTERALPRVPSGFSPAGAGGI